MISSRFVYAIYIRTTAEALWRALTEPEFTRRYWHNTTQECTWKQGAPWRILLPDGRVADMGEILEIEPGRHLCLSWRNELFPELREEGFSQLTYDLEEKGETVKLTLVHEIAVAESKFIEAASQGWPHILSSLKSLLETGESLEATRGWPKEL